MINESLMYELKALTELMQKYAARITVLEEKVAHLEGHAAPMGASGTMTPATPAITGYITPKDYPVNMRTAPSRVGDNIAYKLAIGGVRKVVGMIADYNGDPYMWYITDDEKYAREDVVVFSTTEPAPLPSTPLLRWPSPLSGYTITNRHEGNHKGYDLAAPLGTRIYAPAMGTIVKWFDCEACGNESHPGNYGPAYGDGYGRHIILRIDPLYLPMNARGTITGFVFLMFAHLSSISVKRAQPSALSGPTVLAGQEIARVGSTGNSSGAHLHIEARTHPSSEAKWWQAQIIDPSILFDL